MKRTRIKARRKDPRRRDAPRWTPQEWAEADLTLHRRAGSRCECCGEQLRPGERWERHHRIRRRDGGDRLANLMLLRSSCHQRWTEHPGHARTRGIIVPTWTRDVAAVPLLHRGVRWVVLDDDGGTCALPGEHTPVPPPDTPEVDSMSGHGGSVGTTEPPGSAQGEQPRGATS